MTTKERWNNALRCEPIDRLPFWPKLDGSYARAQAKPFQTMSNDEIHAYIGSEPPTGLPSCVQTVSKANVQVTGQNGEERTLIETPVGSLSSKRRFDPGSQSWHPTEFPIKTRKDIEAFSWMLEHTAVQVDHAAKSKSIHTHKTVGDQGATIEAIGTSALMNFVEYLAGVENAHYFLADFEPDVAQLFVLLNEQISRRIDVIIEHSPADMLMMVENTSTTLISPEQYRNYCINDISAFTEKVRASQKAMVLHMCGYLHALLPQLKTVGAHAFEAFTSPPVGNTPIYDGRSHCEDVCLIGGTNAALWLEPAETIIAALETDFVKLPHTLGLIPSSAGVMPPVANPDKIKAVCKWVNSYSVTSAHSGLIGKN